MCVGYLQVAGKLLCGTTRALFATVEIEETVPREHFEAVAKVIGFVMNTAKGRKR